jgi:hypothetical protein
MQLRAWPWRPRKMVARLLAVVWANMLAFHWRHLGAGVGEVVPLGRQPSPRVVAAELVHHRRRAPIHVWTDDGGSQSQAKAQVRLVELLLHAPHHGAAPLLAGAQFARNRWNIEHIWDEVCRLQLQMHGFAYMGAAPDMGVAGINAATPPPPPRGVFGGGGAALMPAAPMSGAAPA